MSGPPQPGEMRISIGSFDPFSVVRVAGEIDISTTPRLKRVLEAVQRASACVALDMTGVEFIDSTGLVAIVEANRRAAVDDGRFVIVGALPGTRRVIRIAGLEEVLTFVDDLTVLRVRP